MAKSIKDPVIPLSAVNGRAHHPNISRRRRVAAIIGICVAALYWLLTRSQDQHHPRRKPRHRLSATEAEKIFLSVPNAQSAWAASRDYATHPHLAGTPEDFEDAKVILKLFQDEFGIHPPREEPIFPAGTRQSRRATLHLTDRFGPKRPTAWIDTYFPVLNTPLDRHLEILEDDGKVAWDADLEEDGDPLDEDAAKYRDTVPTWHGLSFDGSSTGHLVYANYGNQEDYKELLARGVNFTGKIVLTRYGGIFRGLKIKGAQELGATGVLIYSDPRDDGYVTEENGYQTYPHGPARNPTSVQRGSVQFLSFYPGDPATPGYPAYENATREEGTNIPKIPSLPISWKNAQVLLKELEGKAGENTRQLNGRISKRKVKLVNHVDNKITPVWNTMASIPGHIKDEVVIIGCHRDAWILGAADPTSGTVSLHEVIRGFGELLRKGWKPVRTIVIASWDAEEYGLVGSTEWGEDFEHWISDHVVAYINVDVSVSGSRWHARGSPSLAHLIKKAALEIPHPSLPGKTLWDAQDDKGPYSGNVTSIVDPDFLRMYQQNEVELKALNTGVSPLGSGSDYTVFLERIGVASTDEAFGDTPTDAIYHYHSIYDSQRWQEVYADPDFERHVAVAKHLGLIGLRLIDAIVLPLNTTQYAYELDDYLDRVIALSQGEQKPHFSALRASIKRLQLSSLALDKEKEEAEAKFKELLEKLPSLNKQWHSCKTTRAWGYVNDQVNRVLRLFGMERNIRDHQDLCSRLTSAGALLGLSNTIDDGTAINQCPFPIFKFIKAAKRVGRANKKLIAFERGFISKEGIRDREWYRHLGVSPGKWLGYGATTLPALTEAVAENKAAKEVQYEVERLVDLLDNLAKKITP